MDSKNQLNMGGSGRAFISDLKNGIVDARQEFRLLKQELQDAASIAQRFRDSMSLVKVSAGGGGASPNQIAPDPEFTPPASQGGAGTGGGGGGGGSIGGGATAGASSGRGNNSLFYTPPLAIAAPSGGGGGYSGGNNLTDFIRENPAAGALFAASTVSGMLTSPAESVEAQLLMQRAAFFNASAGGNRQTRNTLGGIGGTVDYNRMGQLQARMADVGTVLDNMDAMRALVAAQSYGITGPNVAGGAMGGVAMGVAQVSNLLPGIGAEGTMRAYGQMQQARNVNMLRGIGIRLRDEQGNLKPPDQIIDDLWNKICRDYAQAYGTGKKPSEREVLIGLQPGNSMDSMLDMYFGNDPMAKQLVANGLLFKAKSGGGAITKENLLAMGGTTDAMNAYSARAAEGAQGIYQVANAGAAGFADAATALTKLSAFMNMLDRVTGVLQGATRLNAFSTTLLGSGGGFLQKIMMLLLGIPGKHTGGEVNDEKPYIVGEKGPELFIPKSDGVIIPNHLMGTQNRHEGGGVRHSHKGETLKEAQVRSILKQAGFQEGQELDEAVAVARAESGFRTNAEGDKELARQSKIWDYSIGLMQIRSYDDPNRDPKRDSRRLYDPLFNAQAAYKLYKANGDWSPWYNTATKLGLKGGGGAAGGSVVDASGVAKFFGIDPSSLDAKTIAQINAMLKDPQYSGEVKSLKEFIGESYSSAGGTGGLAGLGQMTSKVFNYGGVVINLIAKGDLKDIAKQVKNALQDEKILENASKK